MSERTPKSGGLAVAPNAPATPNNPVASDVELQVHRFWGRYTLATQLPNAGANLAGAPAYTIMRPGDVAWVQDASSLYQLVDRGTLSGGDAIWVLIGGGGGPVTTDYITSPANTAFYTALTTVCPGGADFIVSVWYRLPGPNAPANNAIILSNALFFGGGWTGWTISWNFGAVRFEVYDGSGVQVAGQPTDYYGANRYETGRDVLLTMRVYQSGGVVNMDIWFNDSIVETQVGVNPGMTPSAGTLKLLGEGDNEMSAGFMYYEGDKTAFTDDQLAAYAVECLEAGQVVAAPSETNRWNVSENTPGATWAPSAGSDNLLIAGAPGAQTRQVNRS
jgi:hypothetical protein